MALILLSVFMDVAGFALVMPVGPFLAQAYGADAFQVGLLFSIFALAQFLAIPVLGALSDQYGRRPVLLLCLAVETLAYLAFGLANSLPLLIAARALAGLASGNIGVAQAYLADITSASKRTESFALMGATLSTGFFLGPALGGGLATISLSAPAYAAAAMVGLNFLLAIIWLPESLPAERRRSTPIATQLNPFATFVTLLARPRLRVPMLLIFLCNFAFGCYQANFAVYMRDRFGWGPGNVASIFVVQSALGFFTQAVLVRRVSRRFADPVMILGGSATVGVGYLVIGFVPIDWLLYVTAGPLLAIGSSFWRTPSSSLLSKQVGAREQGLANGGGQAAQAFASMLAPLYAGAVYDNVSMAAPYLSGALFMGFAVLAVLFGVRRQPSLGDHQAAAH